MRQCRGKIYFIFAAYVTAGSGKRVWLMCPVGHEYQATMEEWDFQKNADLNPSQLLPGSGKRAWWKCSQCGHEWKAVIASQTTGHGCPKCAKQKKRPKS